MPPQNATSFHDVCSIHKHIPGCLQPGWLRSRPPEQKLSPQDMGECCVMPPKDLAWVCFLCCCSNRNPCIICNNTMLRSTVLSAAEHMHMSKWSIATGLLHTEKHVCDYMQIDASCICQQPALGLPPKHNSYYCSNDSNSHSHTTSSTG